MPPTPEPRKMSETVEPRQPVGWIGHWSGDPEEDLYFTRSAVRAETWADSGATVRAVFSPADEAIITLGTPDYLSQALNEGDGTYRP